VLTSSLLYTDFRRVDSFEESMGMLIAELKKQAEVNGLEVRVYCQEDWGLGISS